MYRVSDAMRFMTSTRVANVAGTRRDSSLPIPCYPILSDCVSQLLVLPGLN